MEKLSEHLSVAEFEYSANAVKKNISNKMTELHLQNAIALAVNVFEPIRQHRGKHIKCNSGYRSLALNKATKGSSKTSQHTKGEAIDLPLSAQEGRWIMENIEFDQMIFEFPKEGNPSWIHVSYTTHRKNRRQVLISIKDEQDDVDYIPFKGNEDLIAL